MFRDDVALFEFRGPWGVPVQIGSSILFLVLVFVSFGASPQELAYDVAFLILVLVSIYLHELGHAWGSLIQGLPVKRIMLYGGGGFCERSSAATPYEEELLVAMGPIVNAVIWALAVLIGPLLPEGGVAWAVEMLGMINFFLLVFNLMPVMPLDGGKLFHLMMLRLMRPDWAMRVAGAVGLIVALAWVPMMIVSFFSLGFVLLFIPPIALHWEMVRRPA